MAAAPLDQALPPVVEAARLGVERTKEMIAATGKAMALGPRALGYVDPGALSMWLMLKAMAEYVIGEW
jgi:phosphoenolpyruvate---glycerone phosphotransferase subunit DhaL